MGVPVSGPVHDACVVTIAQSATNATKKDSNVSQQGIR